MSCACLPLSAATCSSLLVDAARIANHIQQARETASLCGGSSAPEDLPRLEDLKLSGDANQTNANGPQLSQRAEHGLRNRSELMQRFLKLFADQYSEENKNGLVNLGVAENTLMHDELKKYFDSIPGCQLQASDFTYGNSLTGSKRLFSALISFLSEYFKPARPVLPEHIVAGVGLSAVIDQLTGLLCDVGEGVLIAAPYYNGFDNGIKARCLCEPIGIPIPEDMDASSPATIDVLDAKMVNVRARVAKGESKDVRAVILCNPHNPLGFCYPKETLLAYCRFAEKWNIHLVVDEIYALSVYENPDMQGARPFISMLSIDSRKEAGCDPSRVHILYGMSKDFCSNGLRMGALISQSNSRLIDAFTNSAIFMKVASPADALWSSILNKPELLSWFIKENQSRLAEAHAFAVSWLEERGIPYRDTNAGHFILLDLRKYLPKTDKCGRELKDDKEREGTLLLHLLDQGLNIAPGAAYHNPTPGFFRLTFSLKRDYMDVGLARLENALGLKVSGNGMVGASEKEVSGKLEEVAVLPSEGKQVTDELSEGLMCQCFA